MWTLPSTIVTSIFSVICSHVIILKDTSSIGQRPSLQDAYTTLHMPLSIETNGVYTLPYMAKRLNSFMQLKHLQGISQPPHIHISASICCGAQVRTVTSIDGSPSLCTSSIDLLIFICSPRCTGCVFQLRSINLWETKFSVLATSSPLLTFSKAKKCMHLENNVS